MRLIAGKYKGRRLKRPPESITRPTTDKNRESLFNILQHSPLINLQGAIVLDVFAGSGALGLEALSRGAVHASFVESNPHALKVLSQNIGALKCEENTTIFPIDIKRLPLAKIPADLILIDPPYQAGLEGLTLEALRNKGWLRTQSFIVIEGAANIQLFVVPHWLEVIDKREYGGSVFRFLIVKP